MRSKVKRWLHTPGKYSLPWFPHRKQPCDVSDDPGARMRTINRKCLSSKLHPIIIETKTQRKQSQITARHKVTDDMNKRSHISVQTYNNRKNNMLGKQKRHSPRRVWKLRERTSNAPICKIKHSQTQILRSTEKQTCRNSMRCVQRMIQTGVNKG